MSVNGEAFGLVLNGKIVYCEILQSLMLKSEAFACHRLPEVVVNDHAPCAVIELYGVASGGVDLAEESAVSFCDVMD